jgi:hypothetical protein
MQGRITNIGSKTTIIITEENTIVLVNSLFLPIKFKQGDIVELEDNRIILS